MPEAPVMPYKPTPGIYRERKVQIEVKPEECLTMSGLDPKLAALLAEAEAPVPYRIFGTVVTLDREINSEEVDDVLRNQGWLDNRQADAMKKRQAAHDEVRRTLSKYDMQRTSRIEPLHRDEWDWIREFRIRRPTIWEAVAYARPYGGYPLGIPMYSDEITSSSESDIYYANNLVVWCPHVLTMEGREHLVHFSASLSEGARQLQRYITAYPTHGYDGRPWQLGRQAGNGGILFVEDVPPGTTPL